MNNKLLGIGIATVAFTATSSFAGGASLTLLDPGWATDVAIDSLGVTRVLTNSLGGPSAPIFVYESFKGSTFAGTFIGEGIAWGISEDGSAIAAKSLLDDQFQAARWTQSGGWEALGSLGATGRGSCEESTAYGISADGSMVTGLAFADVCSAQAFVWSEATGMRAAFIWTRETGILNLQEVLIGLGVTIPDGVSLEFANAISADGTVIVGRALDVSIGGAGPYRSFVATLPAPVPDPCAADLDDSGQIGFSDLTQILNAWGPCECSTACPEDLSGDGQVGFGDLTALLSAWGPCV